MDSLVQLPGERLFSSVCQISECSPQKVSAHMLAVITGGRLYATCMLPVYLSFAFGMVWYVPYSTGLKCKKNLYSKMNRSICEVFRRKVMFPEKND